jgi:epoxyqueuosine reductase
LDGLKIVMDCSDGEKMGDLIQEVKDLAKTEGADMVGVTSVEDWDDEEGHRPTDYMSGAKSVIVLAARILSPPTEKGSLRYYTYSAGMVDELLNRIGYKLAKRLMDKGYNALPMKDNFQLGSLDQGWRTANWFKDFEKEPSYKKHLRGEISFKYAAKRAGLGVFGKSGLIVTPRYGPLIHILPIVTDAPLEPDKPLDINLCGNCTVCIDLCPGNAITEKGMDNVTCFKTELNKGVGVPGVPYKVCPAYCIRRCPIGNPKAMTTKDENSNEVEGNSGGMKAEFSTCRVTRSK